MSASFTDLLDAFLVEVFNESDPAVRRAAIERYFTEDVLFVDHDGSAHGWDGIDATVEKLHARAPGFVFAHTAPSQQIGDLGYAEWGFGPAGAAPVIGGRDIVFADDGRISRLYTVVVSGL